MAGTHTCSYEGFCAVPPHPDLQARIAAEALRVQSNPQAASSNPSLSLSQGSLTTGNIPGLNDGTIFPASHFAAAPSSSQLSRAALERAPLSGTIRAIVVLADFSDKPMAAGAAQRFKDLFFSTGKVATGSVTEYFTDVSGHKVTLAGEVVGPYRMPLTLAQYANGAHGTSTVAPNIRTLGNDALAKAKNDVNFNTYDNDGNGYIDAFVVVHAGRGGEETGNKGDIWSVKWVLPDEVAVNDVKAYAFLTVPEDALLGVCAHELGHLLFGWPDLYDTDFTSEGIGNWCLMAGGSWGGVPGGVRPAHPSAWCKATQNWVSVVDETANRTLALGDVKTSREVHRVWKSGDTTSKEYFLIENRGLSGFDESLPGPGLLVWHIDDSIDSNKDENHPKVALMQSDGLNELKVTTSGRGDTGDPFPGRTNNKSFTSSSNPNSKSYAGADTGISITNISEPSDTMSMYVRVKPGSDWLRSQFHPSFAIAKGSDMAAVSRNSDSMEMCWVGSDGSVKFASWSSGLGWKIDAMIPAGSAAPSGIAAASRADSHVSVWWITPSGAVEGAFRYDGEPLALLQVAPDGSADAGTKLCAVSRRSDIMEVWWISPHGSVENGFWRFGFENPPWNVNQVAEGGSATPGGGIAAVSRIPTHMEIWWIAEDGSVQGCAEDTEWTPYELSPAGSAAPGTSIAAVSRVEGSMEVWWIALNGSVQDASWNESLGWKRTELAPAGSAQIGGIEAVSRVGDVMEVWWTAPDGSVQEASWYSSTGWTRSQVAAPGTATPGAQIAGVSRIPECTDVWVAGPTGTVMSFSRKE